MIAIYKFVHIEMLIMATKVDQLMLNSLYYASLRFKDPWTTQGPTGLILGARLLHCITSLLFVSIWHVNMEICGSIRMLFFPF